MRDKRGDLMNWVLGAAIAVIGLVLLFYAVGRIYHTVERQESENAKTLINEIEERIGLIEDGQSGTFTKRGVAKGWYMAGWNKTDENRPEKCFFNSCFCVCKSEFLDNTQTFEEFIMGKPIDVYTLAVSNEIARSVSREKFSDECQEDGFCRSVEYDDIGVFTLSRNNVYSVDGEEEIGTAGFNAIVFADSIYELNVSKMDGALYIKFDVPYRTRTFSTASSELEWEPGMQ